ncbi:unnamed protein product [Prorocentrum cordatum]|uniref:Uncharacterized protein n=1 Tax=Prorocentrum cordatum TaxID=2364126 RepID=A0ABN9X5K3_9DINO|nr:unnamed protein product [Polarella glacialis]
MAQKTAAKAKPEELFSQILDMKLQAKLEELSFIEAAQNMDVSDEPAAPKFSEDRDTAAAANNGAARVPWGPSHARRPRLPRILHNPHTVIVGGKSGSHKGQ